ncbi:tetratricopeptide repeat protein [Leptolyngbya sp. FACHB-8]|nr:tetratricopeptide repeat protein [Leptolyngbya sp. FACHB-8]MBD1911517.1 tetratricopeptide repeat protein [Leptolyngbya sp. FACHB-8]MBD2155242.1 tetratricopeptide repeat protein [Leptolyngbya sp. FACHB-16]
MMRILSLLLVLICLWCGLPGGSTLARADALPQDAVPVDVEALGDLRQKAFNATNKGDFATAETYWTQILEKLPDNAAVLSNRGNSRVSQNKLEAAIEDYNRAIELMPEAPDPYLNRGAALEGLQQWNAAIADYNQVLALDPNDPAAYNNRGNAEAGLGQWDAAIADYQKASELAPDFAIARANRALALYQTGQVEQSMREMRNLVRKYPRFADMRAALTATLWVQGNRGEAESNWVAALGLDSRYKNLDWVANTRRWPDAMVKALEKFLKLQS